MKKRYVGLLIAAALMAQPLTAYAAGSVSSRPSHDNSSSRSESLKAGAECSAGCQQWRRCRKWFCDICHRQQCSS